MQDSPIKDLLKKGIQKSLEEQQVPLHLHLKVVDALSKSMIAHKADMNLMHVMANRHALQLNEHDAMSKAEHEAHQIQLENYDQEIQRLSQRNWTGPAGVNGKDAEVDIEALIQEILGRIPMPKDGVDGKDGNNGKDAEEQRVIERIITKIQKEKVIDVSHIRNAESFIFNTQNKNIKVKFEELMSGIGKSTGSTGFQVPLTGAVNGSNQVFTWTTAPQVIVVDQGRPMQKVSSDGTINWTGTTSTTLAVAPTFDVFSTN